MAGLVAGPLFGLCFYLHGTGGWLEAKHSMLVLVECTDLGLAVNLPLGQRAKVSRGKGPWQSWFRSWADFVLNRGSRPLYQWW